MGLHLNHDVAASGGGFAFVGRHREMDLVLGALRHPPAVVLIEGEAGIGKTRLVHEVAEVLSSEDVRVMTGICHPLREPFPFGPVIDALRRIGPWLPPAIDLPPTAGALTPLLPELAGHLPAPPPRPPDPRTENYRLVQAVRTVLGAVGPAVLVVEDVHWVDEATRELLLLLARDLPAQLSLVLTYRAEDLPARTPVLGSTYRRPPGTSGAEIRLSPLNKSDIRQMAVAALGRRVAPTLGRTLFERSQGLPIVAEEDLITLVEHIRHAASTDGTDYTAELERAQVPRGLREAVTERLAGLSKPARAVVDAAAVLAMPAIEPLITKVAGLDPEQSDQGLTEVLQASLLQERGPTQYAFRHSLAQQVAYEHIPERQRFQLHRRAIEALQERSPSPLVQILHHTLALGDHEAWLRQAEAAADQAIAFGDTGTAAALLHQILDQPRLESGMRVRAALGLGRIAVSGVDYSASSAVLRDILSDPQLPMPARGEIRLSLGLLMVNHAGDRSGFRELEKAVDELATRPESAARAMISLAMHEQDEAADQTEAWMRRAERTLQASTDAAAKAAVHATRLSLMARDGDPAVWRLLDELPRQADDPAVLRQNTRALYNSGELAIELGHTERATALLEESRELARHADFPHLDSYCRIALQRLDGLAGHWTELEKRFAELGTEFPDVAMATAERALFCGLLAAARGQRGHAQEQFTIAAEYGEKEQAVTLALRAAAAIASAHLAEGASQAAWETAAPAMGTLRRAAAWARGTGIVPAAVEAALACGHREEAQRLADDAEHGLRGRDAPAATADVHLARGMLLQDTEPAAAAEQFEHARLLSRRIGRPYDEAQATERCARTLIPTRPDEAGAQFTEAIDIFTRLGATSDAARCQRALRDLGLARPSPRGRRGYGEKLSPREQEVARLLAQSATNQDIARILFLSPRTVEHHVARTLKKLGVTRQEVDDVVIDRAL